LAQLAHSWLNIGSNDHYLQASRKLSGPKPHWQSHPEDQSPDSEGAGDVTQRQKYKDKS